MARKPPNPPQTLSVAGTGNRGPVAPGPTPLPCLRFRLRHVFWGLTAASLLMAAMASAGGAAAWALLLAALVVGAHVSGTALGSHLRRRADELRAFEATQRSASQPGEVPRRLAMRQAPRSAWHGRGTVALPWLPRLIAAVVVAAGIAGALLLNLSVGHRTSLAGIIVGAVSIAVIGGWFAFLGGSFYGVVRHGFREAAADARQRPSRRAVPR